MRTRSASIGGMSSGISVRISCPCQDGGMSDSTPETNASTEKTETFAKVVSPDVVKKTMSSKPDVATLKAYSAALDAMDKKNDAKAIELLKQVHNKYPDFEPAVRHLSKLGVTV